MTVTRAVGWVVLIILGAIQSWSWRFMGSGADSIAYLDIADRVATRGWWAGINGCWSPLYSWILVPLLHGLRPSPQYEVAAVHAVNLIIFLGALAAFEYLLAELLRWASEMPGQPNRPPAGWRIVGYLAFAWGCLRLVSPADVTPDLIVAGLVYLSTALLLRARRDAGRRTMAWIGVVAGIAYLAKSVMFPVGLITVASAAMIAARGHGWRHGLRRGAIALLAFVAVAAPLTISLSVSQQRLTFGDAGRLNYAWYVNGVQRFTHWQGGDRYGAPTHPPRRLAAPIPSFEFATPVPGSYPLWHDPTYWYEGVRPRLEPGRILRVAARNSAGLVVHFGLAIVPLLVLLGGLAVAGYLKPAPRNCWIPYVPLVACLLMYALVNFTGRYLGGQLSALLLAVLLGFVPTARMTRRISLAVPAAAAVALLLSMAGWGAGQARLAARGGMPNMGGEVARALHDRGVAEQARVGVIGSGLTAYWSRTARVRIIAETPDARRFWEAPAAEQTAVLAALTSAGATAFVADNAPGCERSPGWEMIGWGTCLWRGPEDRTTLSPASTGDQD